MCPWNQTSFATHNRKATKKQLKIGAAAANRVLQKTGDEGRAVQAGNAAIKAVRNNAAKAKKKR